MRSKCFSRQWICLAGILLATACGTTPILDLANTDLLAPSPVSQFSATAGTNQINLSWINPSDKDFSGVRIIRKVGAFPASVTDGSIVYEGSDQRCADTGTTNTTEYLYAAFAYDRSRNYSPAAQSRSASCSANLVCPAGYTLVGANSAVRAHCPFCIAIYEMKNVAGTATSQAAGSPWTSVDQSTARSNCSSLGTGYHLMTNPERMAIAREIENKASNWSSATVGSGTINQGWAANTAYGDGWTDSAAPTVSDNTCLYNTASNACGSSGTWKFKRTHALTSGIDIWDFGASVYEWVDWNVQATGMAYSSGPTTQGMYEYSGVIAGSDMPKETWQPANTSLTSTNGIGLYAGTGTNLSGVQAGGAWDASGGPIAGIYTLTFVAPTASQGRYGFRCAYAQ